MKDSIKFLIFFIVTLILSLLFTGLSLYYRHLIFFAIGKEFSSSNYLLEWIFIALSILCSIPSIIFCFVFIFSKRRNWTFIGFPLTVLLAVVGIAGTCVWQNNLYEEKFSYTSEKFKSSNDDEKVILMHDFLKNNSLYGYNEQQIVSEFGEPTFKDGYYENVKYELTYVLGYAYGYKNKFALHIDLENELNGLVKDYVFEPLN